MSRDPTSAKDLTARLKVLQAVETWSARLLGGWLPGIANWEAKHQVGLHLWQDLEIARDLRTRLWELRAPKPDRFERSAELESLIRKIPHRPQRLTIRSRGLDLDTSSSLSRSRFSTLAKRL